MNKMDREGARLENAVESIRHHLDATNLIAQMSLCDDIHKLKGTVDLAKDEVEEYLDSDVLGLDPVSFMFELIRQRRKASGEEQDKVD